MIELIVVIIILGILAAVALPRFTNMQRDARIAKLNAARGAVAAASGMVYGAAQARVGQASVACPGGGNGLVNAAGTGTVCTAGGAVNVTNYYPSGTLTGIIAAAGLIPGAGAPTQPLLNAEGYDIAGGNANRTIRVIGGSNPATCSFVYTQATAAVPASVGATNIAGC